MFSHCDRVCHHAKFNAKLRKFSLLKLEILRSDMKLVLSFFFVLACVFQICELSFFGRRKFCKKIILAVADDSTVAANIETTIESTIAASHTTQAPVTCVSTTSHAPTTHEPFTSHAPSTEVLSTFAPSTSPPATEAPVTNPPATELPVTIATTVLTSAAPSNGTAETEEPFQTQSFEDVINNIVNAVASVFSTVSNLLVSSLKGISKSWNKIAPSISST